MSDGYKTGSCFYNYICVSLTTFNCSTYPIRPTVAVPKKNHFLLKSKEAHKVSNQIDVYQVSTVLAPDKNING